MIIYLLLALSSASIQQMKESMSQIYQMHQYTEKKEENKAAKR